jgi:quinoprotein glucose dehydrogenase
MKNIQKYTFNFFCIIKFYVLIIFIATFSSKSLSENYNLKKIVTLDDPWGSSFLNNSELIVTEKNGKIKIVDVLSKKISEVDHNLNYLIVGQGGLLDIIHHDKNIWISYTEKRENLKTSTSIAKAKFNKKKLNFKNIFQANPPIGSGKHFGSRLAIKGEYLFASIGERGQGMIAQDPTKHPGSIIRINLDGSVPQDNPKFDGKPIWLPEIYQIGVRNPQGLVMSPYDKKIYTSNLGAKVGDWFGEVKKGENYGWKILGWGGTNYTGTQIGPKWIPGFTKAIKYWVPSIAASSMVIYKGEEFKEWNGDALITSLRDQSLRKIRFKDNNFTNEKIIFKGKVGRIRDIEIQESTGKIFLLTDEGSIWRLEK